MMKMSDSAAPHIHSHAIYPLTDYSQAEAFKYVSSKTHTVSAANTYSMLCLVRYRHKLRAEV